METCCDGVWGAEICTETAPIQSQSRRCLPIGTYEMNRVQSHMAVELGPQKAGLGLPNVLVKKL
jgi:hypothetical protein